MASIDRTAYPRFRGQFTDAELAANFTLSEDEKAFVRRHAHGEVGRLSMAVSLKTRQFLGYFPALEDMPDQIRRHVANLLGLDDETVLVDGIARPATVHRYREAIRKHLGSRPFSHGGREVVIRTVHRAAQVGSSSTNIAQPTACIDFFGDLGFRAGGYIVTCNKPSIWSCSGVGVLV